MKQIAQFIALMLVFLWFASCEQKNHTNADVQKEKISSKESLVVANRYLTKTEDVEIENYIRRHKLNTIATGSGLRYAVISKGDGPKPLRGDQVTLNYTTRLITGDVVYSSAESEPMQFIVGKGGVASGLEEAILQLNHGDQAVIILPSHLAFGLLGDQVKIPARATVIYEIEFIKLRKND